QGKALLTCQANGNWSAPPPKCVPVSCSVPERPENSNVSGEDFKYGRNITYKCRNGYNLQGEAILTCQANGAWSAPPPKCDRAWCGEPELPKNSIVSGKDFQYGGIVTYTCRNGYILQ
ncbi:unnamed protein product, partial [Meganyctiphanes norvegica]